MSVFFFHRFSSAAGVAGATRRHLLLEQLLASAGDGVSIQAEEFGQHTVATVPQFETAQWRPGVHGEKPEELFVLTKIDEILAWEQQTEQSPLCRSRRYLCEIRAGQYWRLEKLKSFDEFLERRFPESSRRKAYYLMSIHEHLPPEVKRDL
jgi:hypothetical protein